ncbi:MAG: twin-arginine translocation pathway signal protein [Candidatus Tectimicrobiota bacterium]|nr:MAG: twin-arginine translocation pathway signal protein [Candidatus Tectomicrobia bacterium]
MRTYRRVRGMWGLCLVLLSSAVLAQPIRIGEINSYSGVGAAFTKPYRDAVELAQEEINAAGGVLGRPLEILFRDDKLRPDEAVKHAQELVFQQRVHFLMGTFSSAVGLAVSEFARRHRVLFLAAEPLTEALTWQKGHRYVFRVRPNTWVQGRILAERAARLPYTTYAVIGPDYEYGHKAWEGFWQRLQALKPGVRLVSASWPKLGAGEFSAHITKIVQAQPEAVYTSLFGSDWIAFVKQATPFGLFAKHFFIGILLGEPEYIDPLGPDAPEGMLVTGYPWYAIDTPAHRAFVEAYQRKTGTHPFLGSLVGYITLHSLARAIAAAGTLDTERVIDAFEGLTVPTPIGPVTYRDFDHQSTMGAWVGTSRYDPTRGVAIMVDWTYVPGEQVLPSREEVARLRGQ